MSSCRDADTFSYESATVYGVAPYDDPKSCGTWATRVPAKVRDERAAVEAAPADQVGEQPQPQENGSTEAASEPRVDPRTVRKPTDDCFHFVNRKYKATPERPKIDARDYYIPIRGFTGAPPTAGDVGMGTCIRTIVLPFFVSLDDLMAAGKGLSYKASPACGQKLHNVNNGFTIEDILPAASTNPHLGGKENPIAGQIFTKSPILLMNNATVSVESDCDALINVSIPSYKANCSTPNGMATLTAGRGTSDKIPIVAIKATAGDDFMAQRINAARNLSPAYLESGYHHIPAGKEYDLSTLVDSENNKLFAKKKILPAEPYDRVLFPFKNNMRNSVALYAQYFNDQSVGKEKFKDGKQDWSKLNLQSRSVIDSYPKDEQYDLFDQKFHDAALERIPNLYNQHRPTNNDTRVMLSLANPEVAEAQIQAQYPNDKLGRDKAMSKKRMVTVTIHDVPINIVNAEEELRAFLKDKGVTL